MPYSPVVHPLLRKLNARQGVPLTVLDAPPEVEAVLEAWATDTVVRRKLGTDEPFVLGFVRMTGDVVDRAPLVVPALADDAVLWFAYPKKSSKRYRSDISQMQGWQPLGDLGFEAVRQVSIDADWSALRFRRAEQIATLRRQESMAMSAQGKQRVAQRRGDDPVVAAFLADLPEERREFVQRVHDVVRRTAPQLTPALWGSTLGYGSYHYRYASGREGAWFVIGVASTKTGVSLYLSATEGGSYLAEANKDRLGKVSVGRSCIRAKRVDDLDFDVLAELVRRATELADAGHFSP